MNQIVVRILIFTVANLHLIEKILQGRNGNLIKRER